MISCQRNVQSSHFYTKTALGSTVDSLLQPVAQAMIKQMKHLGRSELNENNVDSSHVFSMSKSY